MSSGGLMDKKRVILASSLLMALVGLAAWFGMVRQEDPFFPYRVGVLIVPFPGADPEKIERLVVEPLERELVEVSEIKDIKVRIRADVALVSVILKDKVYDTDTAWDRVRRAADQASHEFPDGVAQYTLKDKQMDAASVVLGVTGSGDVVQLLHAAREARRALYAIDGMSRIELQGDPGEQVTIMLDDSNTNRLGLSPLLLSQQLAARNDSLPGGSVIVSSKTVTVSPNTEFRSLDEIRRTPIRLPSGVDVPLGAFAEVRFGPAEPSTEEFWVNGVRSVGLELFTIPNAVNTVDFGNRVLEALVLINEDISPLKIEPIFFQPERVEKRLAELSGSLISGIVIVAAVLLLFMGPRLGLVIASIVPLVTFGTVAIYASSGAVLHQVAIIGLVVALGMLVDNAIVMAENIQWRIDNGDSPNLAANLSIRELALPLGTATGTTLAAFLPMLVGEGNTSDFVRGIPIMIMLALIVSYVYAITVTPALAALALRKRSSDARESIWDKIGRNAGKVAVNYTPAVLIIAVMLVAGSGFLMQYVDQQFFPNADRNQMTIDIKLPEGSHIDATRSRVTLLEGELSLRSDVVNLYSFVGTTGSRFYYNLPTFPRQPHSGRIVVETQHHSQIPALIKWVRDWSNKHLPEAEVIPRALGQGPPVAAPIEVRLLSNDPQKLAVATEMVYTELRNTSGVVSARHDLGQGVPTLEYTVNDAVASRHGLSRNDVALTLLGRTQGVEIGQYRIGDEPAPIIVRSRSGQHFPVEQLQSVTVYGNQGQAVPLMQLATVDVKWKAGAIYRLNQRRYSTVSSQLEEGVGFGAVMRDLTPRLEALDLPRGVKIEFGGEQESSGEANSALAGAAPMGILILLVFLLVEFNSFSRIGIILTTVPLVVVGVVPGLLLSGSPFGFNSLVGVIALVGIVVNNAIVLIDVMDEKLAQGHSLRDAVVEAVQRRTRPIILTTLTTIAGLAPLTVTSATQWPPMAWAIISGLLASTIMTLVVIPALCFSVLRFSGRKFDVTKLGTSVAVVLAVSLVALPNDAVARDLHQLRADALSSGVEFSYNQRAQRLTLDESVRRASVNPTAQIEVAKLFAAKSDAEKAWKAAYLPSLDMKMFWARAEEASVTTVSGLPPPSNQLVGAEKYRRGAEVNIRQPIFDAATLLYRAPAASLAAQAQGMVAKRVAEAQTGYSSALFLDSLEAKAYATAVRALVDSLLAQKSNVESQAKVGRALQTDLLSIELSLEQARIQLEELESNRRIALRHLQRFVASPVPVEPELDLSLASYIHLPNIENSYEMALSKRADLKARVLQIKALKKQHDATYADQLPRVDGLVQYARNDGLTFSTEKEWVAGVVVTWTPFSAGRKSSERESLRMQHAIARQQLDDDKRKLYAELFETGEHYKHAEHELPVAKLALETANELLRVEYIRGKAGRSTEAQRLVAVAKVAQRQAELKVAKLQIIRHWLHFHVLLGSSIEEAVTEYGPGMDALQ
ncbi:MAG: multidrug efflux pump [Gammaproteobacteria bacterium]|jgi:multidrug efflux pump